MGLDRHLVMDGLNFKLLDYGEPLSLEHLGNAGLKPMSALQTKLRAEHRGKVMLIHFKVSAVPEKLVTHRCPWAFQGAANIRHAYVLAPVP
jgi:hypothetical protein